LSLVLVKWTAQGIVPELAVIYFPDSIKMMSLRPEERNTDYLTRHTVMLCRLEKQQSAITGFTHDSDVADAPTRNTISSDIDEVAVKALATEPDDVTRLYGRS
jgi:hypothetical protein